MESTLRALLGENAKGLSSQTVSRLKMQWKNDDEVWSKRSLAGKNDVYVWADGVYFSPRGDESKVCMLVLIGVLEDGTKEVITISDGFRESEQSWSEVLLNLKNRGLEHAPMLAIGDGVLGFWNALRKIFPTTKEQRCWFPKKGNVLTKLPDSLQGKATSMLREIEQQPTRELALKEMKHFEAVFSAKYPKAVECLLKDEKALLTFYDFPAEHWASLKTTNLEHGYFHTAGSRITLFGDMERWAFAFEKTGYSNRRYEVQIEINFFGNCLVHLDRAGADGRFLCNTKVFSLLDTESIKNICIDGNFETISPHRSARNGLKGRYEIKGKSRKIKTTDYRRIFQNLPLGGDSIPPLSHNTNPQKNPKTLLMTHKPLW